MWRYDLPLGGSAGRDEIEAFDPERDFAGIVFVSTSFDTNERPQREGQEPGARQGSLAVWAERDSRDWRLPGRSTRGF